MDVILYPEKYKYKYVFNTFNHTAILIFTQENMYLTSSDSSNPFFKSIKGCTCKKGGCFS